MQARETNDSQVEVCKNLVLDPQQYGSSSELPMSLKMFIILAINIVIIINNRNSNISSDIILPE